MIEDARIADVAVTTVDPVADDVDDGSMRVLEWGLAALALITAIGLAFLR